MTEDGKVIEGPWPDDGGEGPPPVPPGFPTPPEGFKGIWDPPEPYRAFGLIRGSKEEDTDTGEDRPDG